MAGILNAELAFPQFPALDQFGPNTTLLLHGDGTNGAQNNTFLDSSANNFTITRNGNTTQGTFSPFSQPNGWWSNYFNNSGYLYNGSASSVANFGTGNYTIEAWFYYISTTGSSQFIFDASPPGSGSVNIRVLMNTSNQIQILNPGSTVYTSGSTLVSNSWYHIVVSRGGAGSNQSALFINGARDGTFTDSSNYAGGVCCIGVCSNNPLGINPAYGYISNLRVVKGTDVYGYSNTSITVPTTPLTAITNTTLLTCQSNRFVDNSASPVTLTVTGTPAVQAFHPISAPTSYFPAVNGGGGYFDGSGDYLNAGSNAAFAFGTGAYTVEMWVYPFSISQQIYMINDSTGGSGFYFETNSSAGFSIIPRGGGSGLTGGYSSLIINSWNHIVFCRASTSSNQTSIFVNGARVANGTDSNNWTVTGPCSIGGFSPGSYMLNGYMSQVRLVKGTDVYGYSNTTITVPTAPLTAIANTSLLLSCTNGGIFDSVSQSAFETVGTAQISTTQSKFGGASMYFDGSSYLVSANTNISNFGSGNFTIESWIYKTSSTNSAIYDGRETGGTTTGVLLYTNSSNQIVVYQGASLLFTSTATVSLNSWFHVALCRTGTGSNQTTVYINGNSVGSFTMSATNIANGYNAVGAVTNSPVGNGPFYGYIDDLRITKGIARYTQNFTPPQNALPDFGPLTNIPTVDPNFKNTTLLLHGNGTNGAQNNTFLDSSTNNFTITRNGNTTQGTFTPFSQPNGWWSNKFNGSTDVIYATETSSQFTFGTGDYTYECWIYPTSDASTQRTIFGRTNTGNVAVPYIYLVTTTGVVSVYYSSTIVSGVTAIPSNAWTHIMVSRLSGTTRIFVNGNQEGSAADTTNLTTPTAVMIGGSGTSPANAFNGYISNARILKGTGYSSITVPTLPLTAITNTSLLTCQSNRFIDNSANAFALTIVGTPSTQNFYPFFPPLDYSTAAIGGSGYFDGTGDYLNFTGGSPVTIGTNSATVECWAYPLSVTITQRVVASGTGDFSSGFFIFKFNGSTNFLAGSGTGNSITATIPAANQWVHIAWVGVGGTSQTLYVNGVSVGTAGSYNLTSAISAIGGYWTGNNQEYFNGYLSNIRVVNGTAVYTSNFTPPTAPLTAITNTSLLLSATNSGIFDNASKNNLETLGNAQISTTQSKFGGSSMYFDGTGDYLTSGASSPLYDWQGDLTIEAWIYPSSLNGSASQVYGIVGTHFASSDGKTCIYIYGNGKPGVGKIGVNEITGSAGNIVAGSWQHLAVVLSGSRTTIYVNGSSVGSGTTAVWSTGSSPIYIAYAASPNLVFNGYIDDFRITKGVSRYNYNFTPPIAQFPNK